MKELLLTLKDIHKYEATAMSVFVNGPAGAYLPDGTLVANNVLTALSVFRAVVDILIQKGALPQGFVVPVVEKTSEPQDE